MLLDKSCALLTLGLLYTTADAAPTTPPQLPLCMIGDSITWADYGDYWRADLLEEIPTLAFVGTHSARLGYSHAGEGGNGTQRVLNRMDAIPDCANYSLLIGTNDNNQKNPEAIETHAAATAGRILQIVQGLLAKPSCRKVFVCSVLPCQTDNPLRSQTNLATNRHLQPLLADLGDPRTVYVDLATPVLATPNWEPLIRLHPTQDGYRLIAHHHAQAMARAFGLTLPTPPPVPQPGAGVRVTNLWSGDSTTIPVIAGWYTISFDLLNVTSEAPTITVGGADPAIEQPMTKQFKLDPTKAGTRVSVELYTLAEGYGYKRGKLGLQCDGCEISQVLWEKKRPSGQPSSYGQGTYLDTVSPILPGELVAVP